jgi:hypothetical protein
MELERWRKEEERWIPTFRVEEYVYNSMYDLTIHDPSTPSISTGRVESITDGPT